MRDPRATTVLVADRRPLTAHGLAGVLNIATGFQLLGSCHSSAELRLALQAAVEVVILDSGIFGNPLSAVRAVRDHAPATAILLTITVLDEQLVAALAYEGVSCVSAFSSPAIILAAVESLLRGLPELPPEVQRLLARRHASQIEPARDLTAREEQVFRLAAQGFTVAQLAQQLHISASTAKAHLARVYEKLGAPNRSAAVATAMAQGLLTASDLAQPTSPQPANDESNSTHPRRTETIMNTQSTTLNVIIAHTDQSAAHAIRAGVALEPDMVVKAIADHHQQLVMELVWSPIDVVLLHSAIFHDDLLLAIRAIEAVSPGTATLLITDATSVPQAVAQRSIVETMPCSTANDELVSAARRLGDHPFARRSRLSAPAEPIGRARTKAA